MPAKKQGRSRARRISRAAAVVVGCCLLSGCAERTKSMRYFNNYDAISRQGVAGDDLGSVDALPGGLLTPEGDDTQPCRANELAGDRQMARGKMHLAYVKYEKAVKGDPENPRLYYKRGLTLLLGRLEDKAIQSFRKALALDPGYARAWEGIGQAHFQKKDYADAREAFLQALERDERFWRAHLFLGVMHDYKGEHDQAVARYRRAVELAPAEDQGALYNNLGVSYTLAGRLPEAVQALQTAVDKGFTQRRTYNNLGVALSKAGRTREAIEMFARAGTSAQAYNNLGCVYMAQGQADQARDCFRKAIHLEPGFYAEADENLRNLENGTAVR